MNDAPVLALGKYESQPDYNRVKAMIRGGMELRHQDKKYDGVGNHEWLCVMMKTNLCGVPGIGAPQVGIRAIVRDILVSQMPRLKLRMRLNDADCQPRMNGCHELNVMYELRNRCKVRKVESVMHIEEMGWGTFRAYEFGKWLITLDQRH
ncbi:hypothetical protein E3N88_15677 [Mikania micrantha]|uniref:Uncharacterized protein n=1 Tax=Mikania micrantha TaxID=192012 RepID=A0A5N6NXE8_9ASTR|nr:hypothetical protein E3N88_15677 [Mikania micrantha]